MALFNEALLDATSTTAAQAGGIDFVDKLQATTFGATISGLGSIYNTFAAGVNVLGGDMETVDTAKKLADLDLNWAKYYQENQNAIDIAGFIGTSLIPGSIAVKGLNAVRAGASGNAFGRALGFARTKQAEALDRAVAEIAQEGGTVFTQINRNKLAAMGWGFADQTLTAAAFEIGVAATMKQSPLLADDSWWDLAKTGFVGAAFGGFIGGGIDSILLNRSFKDLAKAADIKGRDFDYLSVYSKLGLMKGDEAYGAADALLSLPKEVTEMGGFVRVPDFIASRTGNAFADFSKLFENKLKKSELVGLQDFERTIRELSTDSTTAGAFARYTIERFNELKAGGASNEVIRERLGDLLFELKSVKVATEKPTVAGDQLFYFKKSLTTEEKLKFKSLDDWESAIVAKNPFEENAYKDPYIFTGTPEQYQQLKGNIAFIHREGDNGYPSLKAAWDDGRDLALLPDGTLRVNDNSKYWKRVKDPVYKAERYFNSRTGAITEDVVLTAADQLAKGSILDISFSGVKINERFVSMTKFNPEGDATYFTARHAWASKLADKDIPTVIDGRDISLLERLRSAPAEVKAKITINDQIGGLLPLNEISLDSYLWGAKVNNARQAFSAAYDAGKTLDMRDVAYKLNIDPKTLEDMIAHNFDLGANTSEGWIAKLLDIPQDRYLQRENLILEFNRPQQFKELDTISANLSWRNKRLAILDQVALTGGQFVTGQLAWQYRVIEAVKATKNASTAVLGTGRASQLLDLEQSAAKLANSVGVGSGFLTSSNSNYGEILKLWAQDTGKKVHLWIQEDVNAVMDALNTSVQTMRQNPKVAAELGIVTNELRRQQTKFVWHPTDPKMLIDREVAKLYAKSVDDFNTALAAAPKIKIESDEVVNFLKIHQGLNKERVEKRTVLYNARGMQTSMDSSVVYAPPIDTTYFQHFAFVRPLEGKAFSTSEVGMIFGRDAAELSKRMAMVDQSQFQVITKQDTEKFFKAKGDYDFSLTINEPRIDSEMRRTGALSNFFPEVRPENLMEDYIRWHQNQASRLVRDSVETHYAQQIAELRKMGESFTDVATSKFAGLLRRGKSEVYNPYDDYVKTALDISKRSEYTFFHQANEFVDALGTRAYRVLNDVFGDARKGIVSWTEANAIAERHGIRGMYANEADFFTANAPRDRNLAREYIAKANMLLANFVLRFDFANSLINIVSTPMMLGTEMASIRTLASKNPELAGKLSELTSVTAPGTNIQVPTTLKLLNNAVRNFFGTDKDALIARYKANGDIKDVLSQYHSMMDDLSMRADFKVFSDKVDKAFEKVATLTGNNWSEQFTRFVSADVMRQVTDPLVAGGKMTLKEQNAYISVFVNRVQGNYISSQRPILFQGVLGSAIGLFQTYSFNLLQQLLRHVGNKDKRAVATLYGLQAGLFGLNGTPMFDAVNTHLIGNAATNDGHFDAYSVAPSLIGKQLGDWLLYGTASAFPAFGDKWPALYSRGDINPRHISIVPVNPLDVPAFDASIRVVKNLADVGSKVLNGADISQTILQGLEHNGVNRPLAGMAQLLAGQSTTSKGGLISASSDFDLIMTASRLLGAKPMDEALALQHNYRINAYKAADRDRMEFLGERVKSYLYKNQMPPEDVMDDFMKDYAAAGGRLENFNAALQRWMKDANRSTVEKMRAKMQSSYGQRLSEIMGGEQLEDYYTSADQEGVIPQ